MFKTRLISSVVLLVAACMLATGRSTVAESDPHAYFNQMVARPDHWKSYSLRDPAQLQRPRDGGYAHSNDTLIGQWVTYDPVNDHDPHRQDAAKVIIPAFAFLKSSNILSAAVGASASTVTLVEAGSNFVRDRSIMIGNEIATIASVNGNVLTVNRGAFGTTPQAHEAGAPVKISANSLLNQVRLPLGTSDGHSYFIVWDGYWTDSYLGTNTHSHKTFQLSSGGDNIWHEIRTRYDGGSQDFRAPGFNPETDVSSIDVRSYQQPCEAAGVSCTNWSLTDGNHRGPGTTGTQPMAPMVGQFIVKPNTWTRFFVRIVQRANDWDTFDLWVADEQHEAVQIYRQIPVSVRPDTNAIDSFWLEFNSSQVRYVRGDLRDWVAYVRNVVVLRDMGDVSRLLVRPVSGSLTAAGPVPAAPQNLTIKR